MMRDLVLLRFENRGELFFPGASFARGESNIDESDYVGSGAMRQGNE